MFRNAKWRNPPRIKVSLKGEKNVCFSCFFTELSVKNCLTLYSSDAITEVTLSSTNPIKLLTCFQQGPALRFHVGYDTKRKKRHFFHLHLRTRNEVLILLKIQNTFDMTFYFKHNTAQPNSMHLTQLKERLIPWMNEILCKRI